MPVPPSFPPSFRVWTFEKYMWGASRPFPLLLDGWMDGWEKAGVAPPPFVNLNLGIGTALTFTPRFGQRSGSAGHRM